MTDEKEFQSRIQRIGGLVNEMDAIADPAVRATAKDLVQLLMDLYGTGLDKMLEIVASAGDPGLHIIAQLGRDSLVSSLLVLHGLHPVDLKTRVLEGLDKARPYLRSHGGNVELIDVDEGGVVQLRMEGSCHGCPSSSVTMKLAIEDAIREAAPDVTTILVEGQAADRPGLPDLASLESSSGTDAFTSEEVVWEEIPTLVDLAEGAAGVYAAGDRELLCCRIADTFYAYSDHCPGCGGGLAEATLTQAILTCPACRQSYDLVKAGRGLDTSELHLDPFPLLKKNGRARVALPLMRLESGTH